jgi:branched-chain amino acid transport system permease protein
VTARRLAGLVAVAAAAALPPLASLTESATYYEHVLVRMMLMGLYAMAWDFLNGFLGLFSFGHAAFFGAGAYVAAMLVVKAGVTSAPAGLLLGVGAAALVGLAVGFFAARVGSVAVFLVTFAFAEALFLLVLSDPGGLTGGDNGLNGVRVAPVLGLSLDDQTALYYAVLVLLVLAYLGLSALTRTPFGRVLEGIRENEVRIRFAGYRVEAYKTVAFGVSGAVAGLAGVLTAWHEKIASPENLGWAISGDAVLYAVLGGTGTLVGPVLGASLVIAAREVLSELFRSWLIFVGLTYIALVFFLPQGLYPLITGRRKRP